LFLFYSLLTEEKTVMTTAELAKEFTDLLKAGKDVEAAQTYNAPDIVSIEAMDGPMSRLQGTEALRAKYDWWFANHEVHSASADGPYVNGDQFAVGFEMDVTVKATGVRSQMKEVGLYTVRDGKIVEERFFY
jgi:ketosteroid isomerase-like protein